MGSAEVVVETQKFFIRLNEGRRLHAETVDGGRLNSSSGVRASRIRSGRLRSSGVGLPPAGVSVKDVRRKLMRLACVSCVDGVTDENVMAFLDEVGPSSPLALKCLKILRVDEADAERVGMITAPWKKCYG